MGAVPKRIRAAKIRRVVRRGVAVDAAVRPTTTWLFDLDDTLHDATVASLPALHVAMGAYIETHLGLDAEEASVLRRRYWQRYGATLLGLVRHHGVNAAHFLAETHRMPDLEARLHADPRDRAALARLPGRKYVFTNAPREYAIRVLRAIGWLRLFDGVIAIEDMAMFRTLRPKPDRRMLRAIAAVLGVPPSRCVLVEDTPGHLKSARGLGMGTVHMLRYRRRPEGARWPKRAYVCARIGALRTLTRHR